MKTTLSTHQIADALKADDNANWSWNGSLALAEYLENYEAETGEEMELDIVAVRCEFSEYASLQDWAKEYHGTDELLEALEACGVDEDIAMGDSVEDIEDAIRTHLELHTSVIEFDGGIIVSDF